MVKALPRKIIHIDCDCFYASIEMRDDPKLVGKPIAVGGTPDKRGVVATCNYEARAYGVRSAMSSQKAYKLCPDLLFIRPRFDIYRAVSKQIHQIFQDYTSVIEPLSLDEAYLDVTDSPLYDNSATRIAKTIQQRIYQEIGITASAGVAPNKFLAKIASDWKKPSGLFVITPDKMDDFILHLPVHKLHGVGKVTAVKLNQLGINTCYDLRQWSRSELLREFGSFGERLWHLARGIDDRPVKTHRRQSVSVERTFEEDLPDLQHCLTKLPELIDELNNRIARLDNSYKTGKPFVKVKFHDFTQTTLEQQGAPLDLSSYQTLLKQAFERGNKPVRLLGIGTRVIDLKDINIQLTLFN
ncbi:DNA polymerase IV [Entomomonas asaccharolytica]|uniref:DNA polymerase IV n=1 Tax=Entomomonas asaccharolytica TaxID=2785331 RepID=A0A974NEG3_9GAMM|nr:DNA polymerase IV [Entomomonas asaccharolytica]QQP84984.1 DNA polymerase IV [Entomomonas asaccharolytica]